MKKRATSLSPRPVHYLPTVMPNALPCGFIKYGLIASTTIGTFPSLRPFAFWDFTKRKMHIAAGATECTLDANWISGCDLHHGTVSLRDGFPTAMGTKPFKDRSHRVLLHQRNGGTSGFRSDWIGLSDCVAHQMNGTDAQATRTVHSKLFTFLCRDHADRL